MAVSGPQRITVAGPEPLVLEVDEAGTGTTGAHDISRPRATRAVVLEATASASDRAEGRRRFHVVVDGWAFDVAAEPASRAALRERAARAAAEAGHLPRVTLRAQIPGRVVRVWVAPGETVEAGQRLLAVEAMKMENEVRAPRAGTVESVAVAVGQAVELGAPLIEIG
jgi:biotin carboxyl carrier protein